MNSKTYKLVLEGNDKTFEITGLSLNGTNYVSETEVDTSKWPERFKFKAIDSDGNITREIEHAFLVQQECYEWDNNRYYLAFAEVDPRQIEKETIHANINAVDETALAGLMATTDLYEELLNKGVI